EEPARAVQGDLHVLVEPDRSVVLDRRTHASRDPLAHAIKPSDPAPGRRGRWMSVVQVHARMPLVDEVIREAASAVVARDGERGLEVVVLERGAASRFLPGYVASPGGSADREDRGLARRWFGAPEEARRACVVRELVEEVSLVLTRTGLEQ